MRDVLIQLATAFLGAFGFSLMFGLRRRYVFAASLGGLLAWAVYLLIDAFQACGVRYIPLRFQGLLAALH